MKLNQLTIVIINNDQYVLMRLIFILLSLFCLLSYSKKSTCMDYGAILQGMDDNDHPVTPPNQCGSLNECINMICQIRSLPNVSVSYVKVEPYVL